MEIIGGVDISNWGGELSADQANCWHEESFPKCCVGVDLGPGHVDLARQQLSAAAEGGERLAADRFAYWGNDAEADLVKVASALDGFPIEDIAIDFEDESAPLVGYSTQELVCAWVQNFLDVADRIWGRDRVVLYTAAWWWNPYTGSSTRFSDRRLHVADYNGRADLTFTPFGGWTTCFRHQYAGSVTVCGYTVDKNAEEDYTVADEETKKQAARTALLQHWAGLIQSGDDALIDRAYLEQKYVRALAGKPT
jgi:hypothetical protein